LRSHFKCEKHEKADLANKRKVLIEEKSPAKEDE
jgi:hypothetical protein